MRWLAVIFSGGLCLLAACSGSEHEDLKQWMATAAKDTKVRIPPLPQVAPYSPSRYQADGALDPFRSAKIVPESNKAGAGARPDLNRQREELEQYPLESLVFVGVMQRGQVFHAIVKADNTLHKVKVGNYLGQDFGVVTRISDAEIALRELIQDAGGDWIERTSVLQLQEQKESRK